MFIYEPMVRPSRLREAGAIRWHERKESLSKPVKKARFSDLLRAKSRVRGLVTI
jgi:hypothetical protein